MKILFVGDLNSWGRSCQRYLALQELGHTVVGISTQPDGYRPGIYRTPSLMQRVMARAGYPVDRTRVNERIGETVSKEFWEAIWLEKVIEVKPGILKAIKRSSPVTRLVFYSEDDMYFRRNQSVYFRSSLSLYDVVFTTKSYNCRPNELPALGARRVVMVDKAYDPKVHRPISVTDEERKRFGAEVCFIGSYEETRAKLMLYLARQGIEVRVWGRWERCRMSHPNLSIERRPLYNDDYIKAICSSGILLCFLRKINRDLQTDRTMEIPACGAFMLAERTDEHLRLFEEGREAVYFDPDNPKELLAKVRYYLEHHLERQEIAARGRSRCLISGYSHHDRLREMIHVVQQLSP